ncbi:hypothetical protein J6590_014348 [Homalodisca vitripennis]|nr:hypothetical protein J6590_014348 [Homalodisca vitripennis]
MHQWAFLWGVGLTKNPTDPGINSYSISSPEPIGTLGTFKLSRFKQIRSKVATTGLGRNSICRVPHSSHLRRSPISLCSLAAIVPTSLSRGEYSDVGTRRYRSVPLKYPFQFEASRSIGMTPPPVIRGKPVPKYSLSAVFPFSVLSLYCVCSNVYIERPPIPAPIKTTKCSPQAPRYCTSVGLKQRGMVTSVTTPALLPGQRSGPRA